MTSPTLTRAFKIVGLLPVPAELPLVVVLDVVLGVVVVEGVVAGVVLGVVAAGVEGGGMESQLSAFGPAAVGVPKVKLVGVEPVVRVMTTDEVEIPSGMSIVAGASTLGGGVGAVVSVVVAGGVVGVVAGGVVALGVCAKLTPVTAAERAMAAIEARLIRDKGWIACMTASIVGSDRRGKRDVVLSDPSNPEN